MIEPTSSPPAAPAAPTWRDPSAWQEDPASTAQAAVADVKVLTSERPEILVGAAFAGGLLSAMVLRRLAR